MPVASISRIPSDYIQLQHFLVLLLHWLRNLFRTGRLQAMWCRLSETEQTSTSAAILVGCVGSVRILYSDSHFPSNPPTSPSSEPASTGTAVNLHPCNSIDPDPLCLGMLVQGYFSKWILRNHCNLKEATVRFFCLPPFALSSSVFL